MYIRIYSQGGGSNHGGVGEVRNFFNNSGYLHAGYVLDCPPVFLDYRRRSRYLTGVKEIMRLGL